MTSRDAAELPANLPVSQRAFAMFATCLFGGLAALIPIVRFHDWLVHLPAHGAAIYFALVAAASVCGLCRGAFLTLRLDGLGVTIRNYVRTYKIKWSDVSCFADGGSSHGTRHDWALKIVLYDGRSITPVVTHDANEDARNAIARAAQANGVQASMTGVAPDARWWFLTPRRIVVALVITGMILLVLGMQAECGQHGWGCENAG